MKTKKRHGGLFQAVAAFVCAYLILLTVPAAVYITVGNSAKKAGSGTESSTAGESAPEAADPSAPEDDGLFRLTDTSDGREYILTAEELLPAAILCEMDPAAPEEALKAQAVACLSLFLCRKGMGRPIECDVKAYKVWTTEDELRARYGEEYDAVMARLRDIAASVEGEYLAYEGAPIMAAYCAISAGATESAENAWGVDTPYLTAVASPGDMLADGYLSRVKLTLGDIRSAARAAFPDARFDFSAAPLEDAELTPSGYVKTAKLYGVTLSGGEIRSMLSLRSPAFTVEISGDTAVFTVRGWGHGVGMSQAGAEFLAQRGEGYREILAWYYPGAELTQRAADSQENK